MEYVTLKDLILTKEPSEKRQAEGGMEEYMTEAAVMLAFAMHLFSRGATFASIHPDGEHGKRFEIQAWLATHDFIKHEGWGTTSYGGRYSNGTQILDIHVRPGQGDVVAKIGDLSIVAECKGGIVNSRHAGQLSRLRKGLHEAAGQLLTRPEKNEVNIAVVPETASTRTLGLKMANRANTAGIAIALVSTTGRIDYCGVDPFKHFK